MGYPVDDSTVDDTIDGKTVIDLANSNPALSTLPVTMVRQANDALLQYISTEQDPNRFSHPMGKGVNTEYFREALASYLTRRVDRIVPCAGVSDGLDRVATVLLKRSGHRPGGFVYVEEHTYMPAVHIFRDHNLRIRTLRSDASGVCVSDLRQQLEAHKIAREADPLEEWPVFVYIIPSFASPTGRLLSHSRRSALLEVTAAYGIPVVADEVYSMLDFTKELDLLRAKESYRVKRRLPPEVIRPPVVSLTEMGYSHVFSVGSFSKVLCPGLRVGWIETSNDMDVLELLMLGSELNGGCMCQFTSSLVASILHLSNSHTSLMQTSVSAMSSPAKIDGNILFSGHLASLKHNLAQKYDALTSALAKYARMIPAPGGNGLFIEGYGPINTAALSRRNATIMEPTVQPNLDCGVVEACGLDNGILNASPTEAVGSLGRVGGYFIWIRLPQYCQRIAVQLSARSGRSSTDSSSSECTKRRRLDDCTIGDTSAPEIKSSSRVCTGITGDTKMGYTYSNSSYLVGAKYGQQNSRFTTPSYTNSLYPCSLEWFAERAWNMYRLRVRLDSDCAPSSDFYVADIDYKLEEQPRYLRLCFARSSEQSLQEGAKRLCMLLRDIYKEYKNPTAITSRHF